VSGKEVPIATKVMAVTVGLSPITHPNKVANSPIIAVTNPINHKDTMKLNHPLHILAGGIMANRTFHPIEVKWSKASMPVTSSTLPSSST
jgi:hypothetical protein